MMMTKTNDALLKELGQIFIIFIVLTCLFEIGFLIYGYMNADKVECNLFGCTFTENRRSTKSYITSECYENGIKINCSKIDKLIDKAMMKND